MSWVVFASEDEGADASRNGMDGEFDGFIMTSSGIQPPVSALERLGTELLAWKRANEVGAMVA
jgi:hypothetical protein